jgi:hypothetical protein
MFTNESGYSDYAPYLSMVGGGMQFGAALAQGSANSQLASANAAVAGYQARSENEMGAEQAELYRQHLNATLGKQAAQIGGANVTMSGSALRSLSQTASLGAQDIARIQTNAARKAWGYEVQQTGDLARAQWDKKAGFMQSMGSLITSGARAYGQWQTPG